MTAYANFNTLTIQGRIYNVDVVNYNDEQWLAVTVISTLTKDGEGTTFTFNTSTMMDLYDAGRLPVGRQVTIVGRIKSITETWFDKKSGQRKLLKRPNVHMEGVSIPTGGLGALPKNATNAAPRDTGAVVIDDAPAMPKKAEAEAVTPKGEPVQF
jgi:phage tail tape-measure protein